MMSRIVPLSLILRGAATVAAVSAVSADVVLDEHPTHSVVLGVVVAVMAALRHLGCRAVTAVPAVTAALAVQPVLHLTAELARPHPLGDGHTNPLEHLVTSETPTALVQVAVPALAIVAVTVCAHLLSLLIARRPLVTPPVPCAPPYARVAVRVGRLGSILRWCGWIIRAARRGPPAAAGYATS